MNLLLILSAVFTFVDAAKILGIFNHPAKSHTFLGNVLFEELTRKGHEVVFVNGYHSKRLIKNYTNIIIEGIAEDLISRETIYFDHKHDQHQIIKESIEMSMVHIKATFENNEIKMLINSNETFDLVISDYFYNDANFIFGHIFKVPIVVLSSFGNTLATTHLTGNTLPFSYVPGCSLQLSDEMKLWERLTMTIQGAYLLQTINNSKKKHSELIRKYFNNPPSMEELYENVALVLTNSHYSFETVRSITPNVVPIGGFHLRKPEQLDDDLKIIVNSAKNGLILFSLGTQIKSSNMQNKTITSILNVFSQLNHTVLWKFERNHQLKLPKNVIIKEWFSQSDILAHRNVILFITHGGSLSMIESLHFGVPMLVIPFNGDQHMNSKFIETRGIGKLMNLEKINDENFKETLNEVLSNSSFKQKAEFHSNLLRKQPIKPLDNAIFWIEHVISQKGGNHLKPASLKLTWLQYNLIDVYCILVGGCIMLFILVSIIIYSIFYPVIRKLGNWRKIEKLKQS